jgi:hypothetical protein
LIEDVFAGIEEDIMRGPLKKPTGFLEVPLSKKCTKMKGYLSITTRSNGTE